MPPEAGETTPITPTPPNPTAESPSTPTSSSTTTEAKPNEAATEGEKPSLLNDKPKPDAVKPAVAPEKYADFKAPEGFELDKPTMEKALPVFKELGLSQENAQKLVDFYSDISKQASEASVNLWKETQEVWKKEIMTSADLGPKLDQVKANVSKMIDSVGDAKLAQDFRQAMDYTGAGNNPAFIRMLNALASKYTEGSHVAGKGPSPGGQGDNQGPRSAAKSIYPNLP